MHLGHDQGRGDERDHDRRPSDRRHLGRAIAERVGRDPVHQPSHRPGEEVRHSDAAHDQDEADP